MCRYKFPEIIAVANIGVEESSFEERRFKRRRDIRENIEILIDATRHESDSQPLGVLIVFNIGNDR
jgi:hypothetical protein